MDIRQLELFLAVMENWRMTKAASISCIFRRERSVWEDGQNVDAHSSRARLAELARPVTEHYLKTRPPPMSGLFTLPPAPRPSFINWADRCGCCESSSFKRRCRSPCPPRRKGLAVIQRRFDLALITLPFETEHLNILPLFEEELLILKPSPVEVRGWHVGSIQPADISSVPFLLYPRRSNMRTIIDRFFRDLGVTPHVIMEADGRGRHGCGSGGRGDKSAAREIIFHRSTGSTSGTSHWRRASANR